MKILKLIIKNPSGAIIRNVDFSPCGISFIYGDIQAPNQRGATINSLGKTLLLKLVDYVFGANEDSNIVKNELHGYSTEALILYEDKKYNITRVLGSSNTKIDEKDYGIEEYRTFFEIKRSFYNKQIILSQKSSMISQRSNPDRGDILACLELLSIEKIINDISGIYDAQDKISRYKMQKKDLAAIYGLLNTKDIDQEIFFIDKEVVSLEQSIKDVSSKIKSLEIADLQQKIIEDFESKRLLLKRKKREYEKNKIEYNRLVDFIDSSEKVNISNKHVVAIFEKTQKELPDMVIKRLYEVEKFHKEVYEERKVFLTEKKSQIKGKLDLLSSEMQKISDDINKIGGIISNNEVYKESIAIYEKYSNDLQQLKYRQGRLSQIKDTQLRIDEEDSILTELFKNARIIRDSYTELLHTYREFIYEIVTVIYDSDASAFFDIKIRDKHLKTRPVAFEFNLKGDSGEGINEVKSNLFDYLLFRYSEQLSIMVQDSSCYNGIDPRQVSGMLNEINRIACENNKQVIVSINKYQLGGYVDAIRFVKENCSLELSETDKLLGFDF